MLRNIFTSIDIGSDSIKIVTCELYNNKLNLLAASSVKSKGIKMGMIINPSEASKSVRTCLEEIESMLGIKIKKVIASIPANFADFSFIKGEVPIVNDTGVVESENIVEAFQIAMETKLTPNKEMVTIIPIDFKVDGIGNVENPLGHVSKSLATRAIMVTTPKKNIFSVLSVLEDVGVEVVDIVINGIGDINIFKNKVTENKIGAIINIGSEVTNVSLYNKEVIVKNSVIGIGGKEIDDLISTTYKIELEEARKIKEKFALAHKKYGSVSEFYETTNVLNEDIKINQYEVSELCMNKLNEMLEVIKNEINYISNRELDYIIFTGGTSMMTHFDYLLNENFGKIAQVGSVKVIGVRNNMYSASVGNIIYFISKLKLKGKNYSMINSKDTESLSSRRNTASVSSDSMLGKVVEYFFGE